MRAKAGNSQRDRPGRGRRIALFGGTFDPIHAGHLAVARAAERRFHLDRVYFIPSGHPPHKPSNKLSLFAHRFAMVTLACAGNPRFVPSLAEEEDETGRSRRRVFYSVDTVRRFLREFDGPEDRLYFLLGADSFLDIPAWKDYEILLGLCDFVVAHRPGFRSDALRKVIPPRLLARPSAGAPGKAHGNEGLIALRHTNVYLLDAVASEVSATGVRRRLDRAQTIRGLVPSRVEDYINKQALYGTPHR